MEEDADALKIVFGSTGIEDGVVNTGAPAADVSGKMLVIDSNNPLVVRVVVRVVANELGRLADKLVEVGVVKDTEMPDNDSERSVADKDVIEIEGVGDGTVIDDRFVEIVVDNVTLVVGTTVKSWATLSCDCSEATTAMIETIRGSTDGALGACAWTVTAAPGAGGATLVDGTAIEVDGTATEVVGRRVLAVFLTDDTTPERIVDGSKVVRDVSSVDLVIMVVRETGVVLGVVTDTARMLVRGVDNGVDKMVDVRGRVATRWNSTSAAFTYVT